MANGQSAARESEWRVDVCVACERTTLVRDALAAEHEGRAARVTLMKCIACWSGPDAVPARKRPTAPPRRRRPSQRRDTQRCPSAELSRELARCYRVLLDRLEVMRDLAHARARAGRADTTTLVGWIQELYRLAPRRKVVSARALWIFFADRCRLPDDDLGALLHPEVERGLAMERIRALRRDTGRALERACPDEGTQRLALEAAADAFAAAAAGGGGLPDVEAAAAFEDVVAAGDDYLAAEVEAAGFAEAADEALCDDLSDWEEPDPAYFHHPDDYQVAVERVARWRTEDIGRRADKLEFARGAADAYVAAARDETRGFGVSR